MKVLTPETVLKRVKIFLDGEDVTDSCFYAEVPDSPGIEGEGTVKLYVRGKNGVIEADRGGLPKEEIKTGMVRWELAP